MNGTVADEVPTCQESPARFRFDYGTTTAYGSVTPVRGGAVGGGAGPTPVGAPVTAVAADTTFHYRLTASCGGARTFGQDRTLTRPPPPPPSNEFSFGKVKTNKKKGTAKLTVNVPGPGELELAKTKKVKADDEPAEAAGTEKLLVKPKGKARKKLNKKGKAKVQATVTYTPIGGEPDTESKRIKLLKR